VHLKSLTLRGFKSFASATTLRFEPGITAVVGPNGSGKSNVVDALAWVMGEQGVKSLRGGKMEDVIFAGTSGGAGRSGRSALGRAEVVLTIDNADGALPIDYTEVSISRTMFRLGGSDYAINGRPCRLLDVQELLSDSGIGREMHVIVGQGRLDEVLAAGPVERRGFLEEAAGVLKHRRRKEKALRKLDAMAANLARVSDLTAELGRQLKPLGRQAETARRAQGVQAQLRDARARLLADDLRTAGQRAAERASQFTAARTHREQLAVRVGTARTAEQQAERTAAAGSAAITRAAELAFGWQSLAERVRGTVALATERANAALPSSDRGGPDPDALDAQAASTRAEQAARRDQLRTATAAREQAGAATALAQSRLAAADRALAERRRHELRRREHITALATAAAAASSQASAGQAEHARLARAHQEAVDRARALEQRQTAVETEVAGMDAGEQGLDSEYEAAAAELARLSDRAAELAGAERVTERERAALSARVEALRLSGQVRDGAAALLTPNDGGHGTGGGMAPDVVGRLVESLTVRPGSERAVAAALGRFADAVVVTGSANGTHPAAAAINALREREAGRAAVVVPDPDLTGLGPDAVPVAVNEHVSAPAGLVSAVRALLDRVVVCADLREAAARVATDPGAVAVTLDGDLLTATSGLGGSADAPSGLEVRAALDQAEASLAELEHSSQRQRFDVAATRSAVQSVQPRVSALLDRLHESDARMAAVAERLGHLAQQVRSAHAEAHRLADQTESVRAATTEAAERAGELEAGAAAARAGELPAPGSLFEQDAVGVLDAAMAPDDERAAALAAVDAARAVEMDARLGERGAQERVSAIAGRAEELDRAAQRRRRELSEATARTAQATRRRARAAAVSHAATRLLFAAEAGAAAAEGRRGTTAAAQLAGSQQLTRFRTDLRELIAQEQSAAQAATAAEIAAGAAAAELTRIREQVPAEALGDADTLAAEYGPDQPVPVTEQGAEPGATVPYVRAEQVARRRRAERALAELGRVNPLALEEYAALTERHGFLTEQLADLRRSRDDLLGVVGEVDQRVEKVFAEAFADTAREFEGVFARLFPGGEGRLLLTDPEDMLATGIEIEARPPGKKVKRLSLLSGGERSLVAVALLVAIFKARPSPFYVLDEVEAALDDTNLSRLLTLYEELRETSQLLVVTHQKRTMEIADALYGVAMRGDGVTTVISQRVREFARSG